MWKYETWSYGKEVASASKEVCFRVACCLSHARGGCVWSSTSYPIAARKLCRQAILTTTVHAVAFSKVVMCFPQAPLMSKVCTMIILGTLDSLSGQPMINA